MKKTMMAMVCVVVVIVAVAMGFRIQQQAETIEYLNATLTRTEETLANTKEELVAVKKEMDSLNTIEYDGNVTRYKIHEEDGSTTYRTETKKGLFTEVMEVNHKAYLE